MARDDLTLWLAGPRASAAKPMPDGRKPEPGGWNRFVLQVTDLAGMVATLRSQGVTFRNDIVDGPGGRQTFARTRRQRGGTVRTGDGAVARSAPRRISCCFPTPARGRLRGPPPPRSMCRRRHGWRRRPDRRPCRSAGTPASACRVVGVARVICRGSTTRTASSRLMGSTNRRSRRNAWHRSCPQCVGRYRPTRSRYLARRNGALM